MTMDQTSRDDRADRVLVGLIDELAGARTPDYLEAAIERASSRSQRPSWTFPGRWLPMADLATHSAVAPRLPWRAIATALVILALLVGAAAIYVGTHQTPLPAPFGPAANGLIPYSWQGDLYLGDPVTGETKLLLAGSENDWGPGYSYDGTLIGFIRDVPSSDGAGLADIYVMRQDGSDLHKITPEPIHDLIWAQWSPDGRIGVIQPTDSTTGGSCGTTICPQNELSMFAATGDPSVQHVARATGMDYVKFQPPDGGRWLYRALVGGKWGLYTMDPAGGNVQAIVPATVPGMMDMTFSGASYSADGRQIFYEHGDEDGCCQLWVAGADGSDAHQFLPRGIAWDGEPIPSPDGKWLAYWHNGNELSSHGISVVRADGTGTVVDTGPTLPGTAQWIWAPDSSRILMFSSSLSGDKAYLLDPAGGPWTTVPWKSDSDLDWQRKALP